MSKRLNATCTGSVVTADGVPVPGTTILSEGVGASQGVLLLDDDSRWYLAKTSPDLKDTLTQVIAALEAAVSGLGSASSGLTALAPVADPIAGPLAIIAAVAGLSSASGAISSAKSALETLKGNLR